MNMIVFSDKKKRYRHLRVDLTYTCKIFYQLNCSIVSFFRNKNLDLDVYQLPF